MSVKQMILAGMGIGFLPKSSVKEEIDAAKLVAVHVEDLPIIRAISLVLPKKPLDDDMVDVVYK